MAKKTAAARSAAKFLSVSQENIEDNIIAYFADEFGVSPASLTAAVDLKTLFNYGDAAWAGLALIHGYFGPCRGLSAAGHPVRWVDS